MTARCWEQPDGRMCLDAKLSRVTSVVGWEQLTILWVDEFGWHQSGRMDRVDVLIGTDHRWSGSTLTRLRRVPTPLACCTAPLSGLCCCCCSLRLVVTWWGIVGWHHRGMVDGCLRLLLLRRNEVTVSISGAVDGKTIRESVRQGSRTAGVEQCMAGWWQCLLNEPRRHLLFPDGWTNVQLSVSQHKCVRHSLEHFLSILLRLKCHKPVTLTKTSSV